MMFSAHERGNRPCPLCDEEPEGLVAEHIMEEHRERLNLEMTFEIMMERMKWVDLNFVCVCVFHGLYVHLQNFCKTVNSLHVEVIYTF